MEQDKSKESAKALPMFELSYGTIVYQAKSVSQGGKIIPEHFLICNSSGARPIQLYRRQMLELLRQLPKAYQAFRDGDTSCCVNIALSKNQCVNLEVSSYNEQPYLFLKKTFKPEDKVDDPNQEWIHTKSNVSFNPDKDNVVEMLTFVTFCNS
jgi:hypothetical protein